VITDARLWHPWLRIINRVLRVMLRTRWSAEAWSVVRIEFTKALALRNQILATATDAGRCSTPRGPAAIRVLRGLLHIRMKD
jgi:hypothetical protein